MGWGGRGGGVGWLDDEGATGRDGGRVCDGGGGGAAGGGVGGGYGGSGEGGSVSTRLI